MLGAIDDFHVDALLAFLPRRIEILDIECDDDQSVAQCIVPDALDDGMVLCLEVKFDAAAVNLTTVNGTDALSCRAYQACLTQAGNERNQLGFVRYTICQDASWSSMHADLLSW